ncbi:SEL1-like repeat protein [Acetobacter fallax]|uniref:Uncharacterized protein n=1 Tax=Acetobacter fallax TaxID=1737473 RepID=A0ABX0KI29_9PROT|nr:SEL1-like repeat protein [Acetobacter fallax]NHO34050.1 hypothetical protein [Acetobacter fallax]NHO37584.1 hypothetical protein [Acetobacter fallax]
MGISTIEAFPAIIVVVATFFTIHARAQENAGSAPFMIRTVISQKSGAAAQGSTPWYGDLKSCEAEARRIGASLGADAVVQCIATSSGNTGSNALPGTARAYNMSRGVPQDYVRARQWFEKAATPATRGQCTTLAISMNKAMG